MQKEARTDKKGGRKRKEDGIVNDEGIARRRRWMFGKKVGRATEGPGMLETR